MRAASGQKPERPMEDIVIKRGLDDRLWECLLRCWSLVPEERPSIQEFLEVLEKPQEP